MIAAVLLTLLALPGLLIVWSALSLYVNKVKARTTGLPLLVRRVTPTNPLWMMFGSTIVLKCRALNIGTKHFRRFYVFGWEANERHVVHQELGPTFMLVSPGGNWLCVSDSSVFADVIHRRTDFRRNMEQFAVLNVYGKNLSTTDDEEWQKHRKSLFQAGGMLKYWLERQPINTIADDTKVFTLNVLATALFSKSYPFQGATESNAQIKIQDDSYQYRDSLGKILLINEERECMERGAQKNQHLVAALVRACAGAKLENSYLVHGKKNMMLSEEEIISNVFEWIAEEICHYLPEDDTTQWAYKTFPKLKRCLVVVMESLRINHPLGQLAKQTGNFSQLLKIGSRNITIPSGTAIHLSLAAIHTHPRYWGEDSLKWIPDRFISTPDGADKSFENEVLASDTQQHFLPWAAGQRVCPGKKFSQVELVATLAFIFRDYTVHPQPQNGESIEQACNRIFKTSLEIEHEGKILHEMRRPKTIALI
ncbi:cytochrome P450 [Melanomma pulvis-pyrius CBS 109.77]|uniref:Cytochrome P450 n=1 Tax=Melanomma pulvis-pyrius CBS 109.77 TaxID=1314802 RepID=A0A6A6WTD8_9PLEO|nr:cytochrome P450 [Melanomma pulvis-pyrius CBS 109.77]